MPHVPAPIEGEHLEGEAYQPPQHAHLHRRRRRNCQPRGSALAGHESAAAQSAWPAFTALTGGYQGFGNLFAGLSLLATGWAAVSQGALPRVLGVLGAIALVAGVSAMASVLIAKTQIGFVLALLLVIVFRVWAGIELYRGERPAGARGQPAGQVSAGSPTAAE